MPDTYVAAQPSLFDTTLPVHIGSSLLKAVPQNCQVLWIESGCPHKPYCPNFLPWVLSLLAEDTRVLLQSVTSRKLCHSNTVLPFCVQGREFLQEIHLTVKIIQHHQWRHLHSGFGLCQPYVLILLVPISLRKNC